jgi:ABC-2 type transport system permease protein
MTTRQVPQVRIEALKLRTTPAGYVVAAVTLALTVLSTTVTILLAGRAGTAAAGTVEDVGKALSVGATVSMAMLVLGILTSAGEDRHRTHVGTFLGRPRRERVLVAKMVLLGGFGAVLGAVTFGLALAVAVPLYSHKGVHSLPVDVPRLWLGSVLVSACYGLLGVALGALTRNTVASVIGALIWVQVIEVALLQALVPTFAKWLPTGAGVSLTSVGRDAADLLAPWAAALVLVGWAAVIAAGAARVSLRRDVV